MRHICTFVILLLLSSCVPDMASYTGLSQSCGQEKIVTISPNIYGIDDDVYRETSSWLEKNLEKQGYKFNLQKQANVLVTLKHEVLNSKDDGPADDVQEVYEGEGSPNPGPVYHHQLTIIIEDIACKRESMTLNVDLDTYSAHFTDIMPELLEALSETFANTAGPRSKTTKRITKKF